MDVNIKQVTGVDPITLNPVTIEEVDNIAPVTIAAVEKVAPVAVHVKELNQIEPLLIESLSVDRVREIDPLHVEQLNVTRLPMVNLSVSRVPGVEIDVTRIPPVAIGIHQVFDLPSQYTARARLLGFEVLRVEIAGRTRVVPRECARREESHAHERSFADVAALGNPAIPSRLEEGCARAVPVAPARALRCGPPGFAYRAGG
ncbi:MAG: hypothetical protein M0002_14930 [Rhodospirillales bacterium]|nr:hypothetical protein [Rhodospirillales bacterium]